MELASRFTWDEYVAFEKAVRNQDFSESDPDNFENLRVVGQLNDDTLLYELVPSSFPAPDLSPDPVESYNPVEPENTEPETPTEEETPTGDVVSDVEEIAEDALNS